MKTGEIRKLAAFLRKRHDSAMACEKRALSALSDKDIETYNAEMRGKAEILAALRRDSQPCLARLPEGKERMDLEHRLDSFSASAANALAIGSVFYMSALLYNDDHKKGEQDNLELFIEDIEK